MPPPPPWRQVSRALSEFPPCEGACQLPEAAQGVCDECSEAETAQGHEEEVSRERRRKGACTSGVEHVKLLHQKCGDAAQCGATACTTVFSLHSLSTLLLPSPSPLPLFPSPPPLPLGTCFGPSWPLSFSSQPNWTGWRWGFRSVVKATTCSTFSFTASTSTTFTSTTTSTSNQSRH